VAREVCARAGAVVVSVAYRLATGGVHYPVPHDDVVAALRVRDDDAWVPAGLLLVYPTVHADMPAPSVELATATADLPPALRFGPAKVRQMYRDYLGTTPDDGYSVPASARLEGLPPTVVLDAEHDDLRTETGPRVAPTMT